MNNEKIESLKQEVDERWSNESQIGYSILALRYAIVIAHKKGVEDGKEILHNFYFKGFKNPVVIEKEVGEECKK